MHESRLFRLEGAVCFILSVLTDEGSPDTQRLAFRLLQSFPLGKAVGESTPGEQVVKDACKN